MSFSAVAHCGLEAGGVGEANDVLPVIKTSVEFAGGIFEDFGVYARKLCWCKQILVSRWRSLSLSPRRERIHFGGVRGWKLCEGW